ncbi:MAG: PsbP-related protein [Ignavibacteria bacterium]
MDYRKTFTVTFTILGLFLLFSFAKGAFAQYVFESTAYKFSITLPEGWTIETYKPDFTVRADNSNDYSSITVKVEKTNFLHGIDITDIPLDTIRNQVERSYLNKYRNCDVMKASEGMLDGIPAYFIFVKYPDLVYDYPHIFIAFIYIAIYDQKFYSLIGTGTIEKYQEKENLFNKIFSTFKFLKE